MRRRNAFTLLEMLLAGGLLLIVLTLIFNVLIPLFRAYAFTDSRANLRQTVAAALDRVSMEINASNCRGLQFFAAPTASLSSVLTVQPLDDPTQLGRYTWLPQLHVIGLSGATGQLALTTYANPAWAVSYGVAPIQVTASSLTSLLGTASSAAPTTVLVPANVTAFTVVGLNPNGAQLPLQVTLSMAAPGTSDQFSLTRLVTPLNRASF